MATDSQKLNALTQAEHDKVAYAKRVVVVASQGKTVSYEDASFVTGDSSIVLDVFTDLGTNGSGGYITNDGPGDFKVEVSNDGSSYGGLHTLKNGEILSLNGMVVDKIRITGVSDSSYRVLVGTMATLEKTSLPMGGTDESSTILLRRVVKLLESNAVVDIQYRQKITIDSITGGSMGLGVALTGTNSLGGIPVTNWPTTGAPIAQPTGGSWQPVWIGPVDQRFQVIDAARLTYDQGIRSHLAFS